MRVNPNGSRARVYVPYTSVARQYSDSTTIHWIKSWLHGASKCCIQKKTRRGSRSNKYNNNKIGIAFIAVDWVVRACVWHWFPFKTDSGEWRDSHTATASMLHSPNRHRIAIFSIRLKLSAASFDTDSCNTIIVAFVSTMHFIVRTGNCRRNVELIFPAFHLNDTWIVGWLLSRPKIQTLLMVCSRPNEVRNVLRNWITRTHFSLAPNDWMTRKTIYKYFSVYQSIVAVSYFVQKTLRTMKYVVLLPTTSDTLLLVISIIFFVWFVSIVGRLVIWFETKIQWNWFNCIIFVVLSISRSPHLSYNIFVILFLSFFFFFA